MFSLPLQLRQAVGPKLYKTKTRLAWPYNRVTSAERALPDFIILGAMKAGTTSLSYYLYEHPETFLSIPKEVHFFDGGKNPQVDTFAKGEYWYRAHFAKQKKLAPGTKVFEATPAYLFNPLAPKRIFETLPNAKLIILLRNPTKRAISHYLHGARRNWDPLPCYEALQAEEARLKPVIEAQNYKSRAFIEYSYKSRGLYREQIERYLEYFPREQMLIFNSNDLFTQTEAALKRVFDFIGVDPTFKVKNLTVPNSAPNKKKFEPHVYEYLNDYFKTHNEALYEFMGEDYGWNKNK
ncbi:sulfotransferase domain-containing protein [Waterburya agarophytonicola K14]|uniref:Sulfotransferase domain-containing protein n=1 Tax=Waterburya agarophytonicola KI4 TaxID=2874699 RepID=A0A964BTM6_9CYAN|nr:sulfotransferase domain-containing protein [Waterburya agarophytonicola]MCC0178641.1 sulfotransferase domain-containing protein [Waterburya agarophytonicola KI4]